MTRALGAAANMQLWLLRAATALLVLVFAQPACFTAALWRSAVKQHFDQEKLPQVQAYHATGQPPRLWVLLTPEAAARLHTRCSRFPADAQWLEVQPTAIQADRFQGLMANPRKQPLQVMVVEANDSRPRCLLATEWPDSTGTRPNYSPTEPSTRRLTKLDNRDEVACVACVPDKPPTDPGTSLDTMIFSYVTTVPQFEPTVGQVVLTPFALGADIVMLPIELIGMIIANSIVR